MADVLKLIDSSSLQDLKSFLVRAARIELGAVHLLAIDRVLVATIAVLYPTGLLERRMPTVLGMRTFALHEATTLNTVVKQRALLDRIARIIDEHHEHPEIVLPTETVAVTWGAVVPPRIGWQRVQELSAHSLKLLAEAGIAEITEVIPGELGEARVRKVRAEVWGRPVPETLGVDPELAMVAGVSFAALSLGFLDPVDSATLFTNKEWLRVSTPYGHVLTRKHPR